MTKQELGIVIDFLARAGVHINTHGHSVPLKSLTDGRLVIAWLRYRAAEEYVMHRAGT